MNENCQGCGLPLQSDHPELAGYAKSTDQTFCQSCFRLRHYRDFKRVRADVDDSVVLDFVQSFNGTIFWIIDLMKLEQSLHPTLVRNLIGKDVVLLVNKRDLIPKTVSNTKLLHGIMRLLKEYPISFKEVLFVSAKKRESLEPILPYLMIGDVAFVGCVNVGKSSVLNTLLDDDKLSVSPVASTTASIIELKINDFTLYDTPGLQNESELVYHLSDEDLILLAPQKTLKPQVFQIYEKQSLVFGGLGAITIEPDDKMIQVVSYLPFPLKRVNPERIDSNLAQASFLKREDAQYKTKKLPKTKEDIELEIFDAGFIVIKGAIKSLELYFDNKVNVVSRKAVI